VVFLFGCFLFLYPGDNIVPSVGRFFWGKGFFFFFWGLGETLRHWAICAHFETTFFFFFCFRGFGLLGGVFGGGLFVALVAFLFWAFCVYSSWLAGRFAVGVFLVFRLHFWVVFTRHFFVVFSTVVVVSIWGGCFGGIVEKVFVQLFF